MFRLENAIQTLEEVILHLDDLIDGFHTITNEAQEVSLVSTTPVSLVS